MHFYFHEIFFQKNSLFAFSWESIALNEALSMITDSALSFDGNKPIMKIGIRVMLHMLLPEDNHHQKFPNSVPILDENSCKT